MAMILKGKHKGKKVTVYQYCNNWVTVKEIPTEVFTISSLEFDIQEFNKIIKDGKEGNTGIMFYEFEVDPNKTFGFRKIKKLRNKK